jgi:predicted ATPase
MPSYVKSIEATGLYNRFDIPLLEFTPNINILHGKNGSGKTTLLHILANTLNGDYKRFAFIEFKSITITLDDETTIRLEKENNDLIKVFLNDSPKYVYPIEEIIESSKQTNTNEISSSSRERLLYENEIKELSDAHPNLDTAYFPAFRTMIEAWAPPREERYIYKISSSQRYRVLATSRAREWFGKFVPLVNFPSLPEIQERIASQIIEARDNVWKTDRNLMSRAFLDIFKALSSENCAVVQENANDILSNIRLIFNRMEATPLKAESMILTGIYDELRSLINEIDLSGEAEKTTISVLEVYRQMLNGIVNVQEESFESIQNYLSSVNDFLEGKRLIVDTDLSNRYNINPINIKFDDNSSTRGIRALSSGERQIVTLIYATTHMSEQSIVLIDEPEISLHIDWQTKLLKKMSDQLGNRQIIVCTHSPVIGENYGECMKKISLFPSKAFIEVTDDKFKNSIEEEE